jgi:hypothetical protein
MESPFGGLLKPFIDSIDPEPTFFLYRDAVANATAPACTILHDPPNHIEMGRTQARCRDVTDTSSQKEPEYELVE